MRQLVNSTSGDNNQAQFHLWWTETMLKLKSLRYFARNSTMGHIKVTAILSSFNYNAVETSSKKFSFKDFFSQCDQISSFLRIWVHLLKKHLIGNLIFCAVLKYCNNNSEITVVKPCYLKNKLIL